MIRNGFLQRWLNRPEPASTLADELAKVLDERLVKSVFQPLVDLRTQKVFAYEALARCALPLFASPPALFKAAVDAGRVGELGRMLRQMSIEQCPGYPLFLNVHPHEFEQGWLVQPNDPIYWHGDAVYLEITESVPLTYFEQCHSVLAEARSKGVMLAVDDLGAGYSNLKYISDLSPEIVKLDRELIAGLGSGTRGFQLLKSIVRLCEDMGARVVAEGIETADELSAVIDAGVHFGQGYLLARPALPPPVPLWPGQRELGA